MVSRKNTTIYINIYSLILVLLFSHFSPLFAFCGSPDPQIYYTIGRGILHGYVPYQNLFDIKGPLIFFLYAFAALFQTKFAMFLGVYIIEVIALTIDICLVRRIISLFTNSSRWALLISLCWPIIFLYSDAFGSGGEAEEFIVPLLLAFLYFVFKFIHNNWYASPLAFFVQGILLGCVCWTKYTCIGAWLAFALCLIVVLLKDQRWRDLLRYAGMTLLGVLVPTLVVFLYFGWHHAIDDLLWGYFGWNFVYGGSTGASLLSRLCYAVFHALTIFLKRNSFEYVIVIAGAYLVTAFSKQVVTKLRDRILLIMMMLLNCIVLFQGGVMYSYYQMLAIPFGVITMIWFVKI